MSFGGACTFLLATSAKNALLQQVRRLRRPRYLVLTAAAVLYLWSAQLPASSQEVLARLPWLARLSGRGETIGTVLILTMVLGCWLLGRSRPRLAFSEPELQFLLAAPATRRQVVNSCLVKALLQSALVASLLALLLGRAMPGPRVALAASLWVALSTMELHAMGASFARARMLERFGSAWLRVVQAAIVVLVLLDVRAATTWPGTATGAASWLLWPATVLVRPVLASDAAACLIALVPACCVLALHYLWVLLVAERWEDAAVARAASIARRLEALWAGGALALPAGSRALRTPFHLPRMARPELVLAWKGLIGMSRSLTLRLALALGLLVMAGVVGALVSAPSSRATGPSAALGATFTVALVLLALLGPAFTGGGLDRDLRRLDLLRAWPLSGARIVLGQALAPVLLLASLGLLLVPVAAFLVPVSLDGLQRTWLALALALVGPPVVLLGVLLQSAVTVIWPGLVGAGAGPLALGSLMLRQVVQSVGVPILLVPAGLTAVVISTLGLRLVGWGALPVAALAAGVVISFEIALGLGLLGRAFEAIDPSDL